MTIVSSRCWYQAVSCDCLDGMRSGVVGSWKLEGSKVELSMPVCHWLLEAKHAGFAAQHCSVGQTTSLHCFCLRTWSERGCGSHLLTTKRPSDGGSCDLARPRADPLFKPRHMFCTLGMPTSVDSSLFERRGEMLYPGTCRCPSFATHEHAGRAHTEKYSTQYSTCTYRRALPSGSRSCSCSCSIPLPALTLTLHPHLFLPSTSALHICMHVCRQGDISRFFFSWIVFV